MRPHFEELEMRLSLSTLLSISGEERHWKHGTSYSGLREMREGEWPLMKCGLLDTL